MPPKPRGRPPKKRPNFAKSTSQGCQTVTVSDSDSIEHHHILIARSQKDQASSEAEDSGEESDVEEYGECGWDELDDEDFAIKLAEMAMKDDKTDLDWLPPELRAKQAKKNGKGAVLMIHNSYNHLNQNVAVQQLTKKVPM